MPGNTYTGTNVGAMGDNAEVETVTFNSIPSELLGLGAVDLTVLASELARLRPLARTVASEPEHDESIVALGKAESAAKDGDTNGALSWLRTAGGWASKVATDFSATLVAKLIEKQIGG
ncbi:MAG: hypothetical protein WB611_09355 [Stellaceae bacterium]